MFEVKATSGNNHLGGDDFDQRIIDWMADEFKKEHGIDLRQDRMALQRLKEAAEKAKIELSSMLTTTISLPFITADQSGPKHLEMELTRAKLEELTKDLVDAVEGPTLRALEDAKLTPQDIDKVILVGGATRMPAVQEKVRQLLGKDPYKGINPDECVAIGAAIQAAILAGEIKDVVLLDVTPLSLGIETLGGVFTKIIERNTTIPVSKSQIFTTAADNQTSVEVHVLQGERPMAADNVSLGRFILDGIPPAPRGVPKIEVTFNIDANGILNVSAKDTATGKAQSIVIKASRLSEEEIERMRKEAEMHAEEDRKKREIAELKNQADNMVYTTEKTLKEFGSKITDAEKKEIEDKIEELKKVKDGSDANAIRNAMNALTDALHKVSTKIYQQAEGPSTDASGATGTAGETGSEEKKDENVVDADFEDVNDNKQ